MSTEISQKPEEVIIKNSEDQDNDSHSGNSLDIIIDSKDKKVKIGDTDNIKSTDNIESKIKFKKLENLDKDEIPTEKKIAFPAGFFSSLTFNWIYKIIKKRTEDNPVKLNSLDEISPEVQSKHIYEQIRLIWYGKYNKKVNKIKSTGYPLFMTLLITNKKKIFISFFLFFAF